MEVKFSNNGEIDVAEVTRPDGSVVALPADSVNAETGLRYSDMFPGEYAAFKRPPEEEGAAPHDPSIGGEDEHQSGDPNAPIEDPEPNVDQPNPTDLDLAAGTAKEPA